MSTVLLRVPFERREQLRALASRRGSSMSETLGWLLNDQIVRGQIPDLMPGFRIRSVLGRVQFGFGSFNFPALDAQAAHQLSATFRQVSCARGRLAKKVTFSTEPNTVLAVLRTGSAVVVVGETDGLVERRTLTADLALDLARQLAVAGNKASRK